MRRLWWLVIALAACGRLGFDPRGEGDDGGGSDLDGSTGSATPPPNDLCAGAIDFSLGVPLADQTIDGARDDYTAAAFCGNGPEVVLRVTTPSAGSRDIQMTATFSAGVTIGSTCPPATLSCALLGPGSSGAGISFAAGVNYVVVDRVGGTGTTFTITVE